VKLVSMETSWIPLAASMSRVSFCAAATFCGSSGCPSLRPTESRTVPPEMLRSPSKRSSAISGRSTTASTSAPRPCSAPRT
jgi:hypothetical protein